MVAGGYNSDLLPFLSLDRIAGARNGLVVQFHTHQFACGAFGLLACKSLLAYELLLVQFAEHSETGLDRADAVRELVAVKRQARLETQSVAAAESARNNACIEQYIPKFRSAFAVGVELEAVLSGVAGAAEYEPASLPLRLAVAVEAELGRLGESQGIDNEFLCPRALYGYLSPAVRGIVENHVEAGGLLLYPGEVLRYVGCVDHEQEVAVLELPVNEQVIDRSAVRVQHHSVEHLALLVSPYFICENMVYEALGVRSAYEYLAHVRDIEHSGSVAHCIVLLDDGAVLNRHDKARERTHLGPECQMLLIEAGFQKCFFHIFGINVLLFMCFSVYCCLCSLLFVCLCPLFFCVFMSGRDRWLQPGRDRGRRSSWDNGRQPGRDIGRRADRRARDPERIRRGPVPRGVPSALPCCLRHP